MLQKLSETPRRNLTDLLKNDITAYATFQENLQCSYANRLTHSHTHIDTHTELCGEYGWNVRSSTEHVEGKRRQQPARVLLFRSTRLGICVS